jgi:hypothetical protein
MTKGLLVIYTTPLDTYSKDEAGKSEHDYFSDALLNLSEDTGFNVFHLESCDATTRVDLLSVDKNITTYQLKELEQELIKRIKQ